MVQGPLVVQGMRLDLDAILRSTDTGNRSAQSRYRGRGGPAVRGGERRYNSTGKMGLKQM